VLVVSNVTSASLSMAIGAALHSVAMANLVGSLALLLSMLFAGFLLSRNKMPGWIGWAANLSYAFEALASNEFHGATDFRFTAFHQPGTPPELVPHIDVTGDDILNTFGFQVDGYWPDVRRLLLLCAVFLTATYLLLKCRGRG
ncbi:ABC2_membrane domain-containing protein, partial [Haematococcus lacustris]